MERVLDYSTEKSCLPEPPPGSDRERQRLEHLLAGFQAFVGHDLANQLVAIQGLARLLETCQSSELDPEVRDLPARLADLTRRVDQHARRFAEMGRVLREPIHLETLKVADVVREAFAQVKASPRGEPGSASDLLLIEPLPAVATSRKLLHYLLVELLHNARAAAPPDQPGTIEIEAALVDDHLRLVVRDNGRGLSAAQLARLGEPGAGLGSFFIAQAVARLQGRLSIQSAPGQGTALTLDLPARAPECAP